MSDVFHAFEYVSYVIPGTVFLYAVLWMSPKLQAPLIEKNIDLGSFGIFLILAFVAGLLLHSVSHYVPEQWVMRPLGLAHRADTLICSDEKILSNQINKTIGDKLKEDMNVVCGLSGSEAKSRVLREMFAIEHKDGTHRDRVELFEARYYMLLDLAAAFIILIPVSIFLPFEGVNPYRRPLTVGFLTIAAILSVERASHFDAIYSRELIQSFLGV